MIVARLEKGVLRVVDRLRETVRLADGLDKKKRLSIEAQWRALACLRRFGQRLRDLDSRDVFAVGTNTLRAADNASDFLSQGENALGHPIDIISGDEEARLIYLGVAHFLPMDDQRRLVVDIGGGSTELIIGHQMEAQQVNSFFMGCVSMSKRLFADGKVTAKMMASAETLAKQELEPLQKRYDSDQWDVALGASGTVKAAARIAFENGWCEEEGIITRDALKRIKKALTDAGHLDKLELKGLSDDRKPVLPGGVAILRAVFSVLKVDTMRVAAGALREGLLHDLVGRIQHIDVRDRSVQALASRCAVDEQQAGRVEKTAIQLLGEMAGAWNLRDDELENILGWAARLHECGMMVAYNQYHRHGEYIILNANLPGFTQQKKQLLAVLVRSHRRKFPLAEFNALPERWGAQAPRLAMLLRLAVTLNRGRVDVELPPIEVKGGKNRITLRLPDEWLDLHPLTKADLLSEADFLSAIGYRLVLKQG
jgi:exopolyphosphatase/guanosine-5'-triphosphate,3'-diphosphate pyrophosphatase